LSPADAWNENMVQLVDSAEAHSVKYIFDCFQNAILKTTDQNV